jgi:hypothetical protein
VEIEGPSSDVADACERVLRSLPLWFGIESSLLKYVQDTAKLPTFIARDAGEVVAFLTVREHVAGAWEVHCIAVSASHRCHGMVPYIPVSLVDPKSDDKLPLSSVTVGPGDNALLAMDAARMFLDMKGYDVEKLLKPSDIPYRYSR